MRGYGWLRSANYPEELLVFLRNVLNVNPANERAIEWSKATKSLLAKTFVQRGIDAQKQGQTDFAKQCFLQAIFNDDQNELSWLWLASITESVEEKNVSSAKSSAYKIPKTKQLTLQFRQPNLKNHKV